MFLYRRTKNTFTCTRVLKTSPTTSVYVIIRPHDLSRAKSWLSQGEKLIENWMGIDVRLQKKKQQHGFLCDGFSIIIALHRMHLQYFFYRSKLAHHISYLTTRTVYVGILTWRSYSRWDIISPRFSFPTYLYLYRYSRLLWVRCSTIIFASFTLEGFSRRSKRALAFCFFFTANGERRKRNVGCIISFYISGYKHLLRLYIQGEFFPVQLDIQ